MNCDKCEAFIFFNIDGVRRIAGLEKRSPVLVELMGSENRADDLYNALRSTDDIYKREEIILSHYRQALAEDIGAKYTIAFCVEHEDQKKTSHYLIHAAKHPLGFAIMKDVMWRRGHSDEGSGGLELSQASRTNFIPLFDRGEPVKRQILAALKNSRQPVELFFEKWVCRPEDTLCASAYKIILLELEAEGAIEVIGKDGKTPAPVDKRRKYKKKPTLGSGYYVRPKPHKRST